MIEVPLNEDSLRTAIRRIHDFAAVHQHGNQSDMGEAFTVLRESLGITDDMLSEYVEWAERFLDSDSAGAPMTLGLMVGLIAADDASQS